MSLNLDIRRATREELADVAALFSANGLAPLPTSPSLANVLVGLEQETMVGAISLDVAARFGLTRWLAVASEYRGRGFGTFLVRGLITRSQELGLRELYALPEGAKDFLEKQGFRVISADDVPREIRMLSSYGENGIEDKREVLRMTLETRV